MPDILIRNVSEEDLRKIDRKANRMGIGRAEYLRRQIAREAARPDHGVEPEPQDAFQRFAALAKDMMEPDFEERAWS